MVASSRRIELVMLAKTAYCNYPNLVRISEPLPCKILVISVPLDYAHLQVMEKVQVQEAIQQDQAGDSFHDIPGSDVEDASPEEMLLQHDVESSDEELDHDDVDI